MAIPENIEQLANDIRTKIYGREVRESLAKGIEEAGSIADEANTRSKSTETKQTSLEKKYDEQIANMSLENPSMSEVVDARVSGYDGQNFDTIGKRMDKVDAQLARTSNEIVDARGGEAVLKNRLDKVDQKYQDVTTQLAQTVNNIGVILDERQTGETDDTQRIRRAIEKAKNSLGVVRLIPDETYLISEQIDLPLTIPINFVCDGIATIKATANMRAMFYKGEGYVEYPKFSGVVLDGNMLVDYCLHMVQANTPIFERCHFKNASLAPLALGNTGLDGAILYEARFKQFKITGVESDKFTPEERPFYGIHLMDGATDNHLDDIVIRNVQSAAIRDEGANNRYGIVHVFGYPEPEYISDYGIDLVRGRAMITGLYTDGVRLAGVKMREGFNIILGNNFYWRYDTVWDKSQTAAVEIDDGCTNYVIAGNIIRGDIGYDIKHNANLQGDVYGNTVLTSDIDNPSNGIIRTPTQFINGLIDDLTINQVKNDGNLIARLNGLDNTQNVSFDFSSGGKSRWRIVKTTGADEGLFIFSYNDDGTFKEEVLSLHRGSGKARFMKDIYFLNAFTGPVVTTPDGTKKYRISVNNNGEIITTLVP